MGGNASKTTTEKAGAIAWKTLIKPGQVTMFSKSSCPFCKKSKSILDKNAIAYKAHETDVEWTEDDIEALKTETDHRSFPNIWIGEKKLGGNTSLEEAVASGKLYELLDLEKISYKKTNL